MNFSEALVSAQKGEPEGFKFLYKDVYQDLYRIAYYTLYSDKDIYEAVTGAVKGCLSNCTLCKTPAAFKAYTIRLLCDHIVSRYKEYRKSRLVPEHTWDGLKQQFFRLTDGERIVTVIWAICGYNSKQLSIVTGLNEAMVSAKLSTGQDKLENSVIVF